MSFSTALSGLQAATVDLNITSNNIANVSTTGFKRSRAEFADLVEGSSQNALGSGVQIASTNQQFGQGNLDFTEAALDLAISGQGFFVVDMSLSGGDVSYTRAGQFGADADGYITNSNGHYLQAFPVDAQGNATSTSLASANPILLPSSIGSPQASTLVDVGVNLDEASVPLDPANFDPTASDTFSHSTSTTVFDSLRRVAYYELLLYT